MPTNNIASPTQTYRLFFLFCIILFLCYSNSFSTSWQMDDRPNIVKNHRVQMTDITLGQIWTSMNAQPGSGKFYRPIACLSLALNWYAGQDKVFGYHIVNWLIHVGTSWLLYLTITALFKTPRVQNKLPPQQVSFIAITATLFWALNPVQTQAVTYIVQRMASMAAFFSLLAIFFYLHGRLSNSAHNRHNFFAASAISYIFAILSKENSIITPLTIPIIEFYFFHTKISLNIAKKLIYALAAGLLISILATIALQPTVIDIILHYYDLRPFTMMERLLTEQRVLFFYLSILFFPHPSRLSIAHDIPISTSLLAPGETIYAIAFNILLIFLAIKVGRKQPFTALAILFFYLHHLSESTIIPLELVFEHRNYLPSFFLFIPMAFVFNNLIVDYRCNKIKHIIVSILLTTLFTVEGYATYTRNKVWESERTLWTDALQKAPLSSRPLAVLALQLGWNEHSSEREYRKALELINRSLTMSGNRKGDVAAQLANAASLHHKLGEDQTSIKYYKQALEIIPNDAATKFNMSKVLISTGDFKRAIDQLQDIVVQGNTHADYYHLIGFCDLWLDKPNEAIISLGKALTLAPERPDILLALGKSMSLIGYYSRARWYFDMARIKGGENPIITLCLIENSLLQQNDKLALIYLHHALRCHPLQTIFDLLKKSKIQYQTVPINTNIILPFVNKEIISYLSH